VRVGCVRSVTLCCYAFSHTHAAPALTRCVARAVRSMALDGQTKGTTSGSTRGVYRGHQ
jgi:hypothetical protein